MEDFVIESDYW